MVGLWACSHMCWAFLLSPLILGFKQSSKDKQASGCFYRKITVITVAYRLFTSLYPFYCYPCHSILLMFSNLNQIFPLKNPISFLKPFFDGSANDESVQRFLLLFSVSERSSIMPSDLENAMESLIKVFHRYAKDNQLSRRELRELMENELSNFLKVQKPARRGLNLWVGLWADPPLPLAGSEGPRRRRQDHEGPGRQRGRPSGL